MKINHPLFAPFDDSAAGGGGSPDDTTTSPSAALYDDSSSSSSSDDTTDGGVGSENDQTDEGDESQKGVAGGLSPEAIAEAVAKGLASVSPRQQQEKELTPEQRAEQLKELRKKTMYPELKPEDVQALFGDEDPETVQAKIGLLQSRVIDPLVQHALIVANAQMQQMLAPVQEFVQQQQSAEVQRKVKEWQSHLVKTNPELKGYEKLVDLAMDQLFKENFEAKSEADAVKAVKDRVVKLGKAVDANFSLKRPQSGATNQRRPMAGAVNSGGTGGGSGGGQSNKKSWETLYS